ncbi:MAG: hypothetical protein J6Q67_02435, partial [Clostridia bacterium]|nr:hypothetical protein [Clostridia bacterium]
YKVKRKKGTKEELARVGPVLTFILTILFFLGFILLSYYALDGEIRLYMLLICSAVFLISLKYPAKLLYNIAIKIILLLSDIILLMLRIITLPLKLIINIIQKQRINKQSTLTGRE